MKPLYLLRGEEKLRAIYRLILIVSSVVIAATTVYGVVASAVQGVEVVGETLVTVEFPLPSFSKPITWLSAALIAFWYSLLQLNIERIRRFSKFWRDILAFFAFFVAVMAFYEVLFNFTLWSGLIASAEINKQLNPDLLVNRFPNPKIQWNLVFATKLFVVLTVISSYSFYFLRRLVPAASQ